MNAYDSDTQELLDEGVVPLPPGADVQHEIENGEHDTILLASGEHHIGKIQRTPGGMGKTIRSVHKGGALITTDADYTIYLEGDGLDIGPMVFQGLFIQSGRVAGIITNNKPETPYEIELYDCVISGGYRHELAEGRESKWGLMTHFAQVYAQDCIFEGHKREHGAYLHTLTGDTYFKGCSFRWNGRTGIQCVGRNTEGGWSEHKLAVVDCVFEDNTLRDGGAQLTAGGVRTVIVDNTRFYFGRDEDFVNEYADNHPERVAFGQGHIVNWDDKGRQDKTAMFALRNVLAWSVHDDMNRLRVGTAPAVEIKNSSVLDLSGEIHVCGGWNTTAMVIQGAFPQIGNLELLNVSGSIVLQ